LGTEKAKSTAQHLLTTADVGSCGLPIFNRKLAESIETIFMMPKDTYTFLSSRIVKEIARLGGDIGAFVPAHVQAAMNKKLKRK